MVKLVVFISCQSWKGGASNPKCPPLYMSVEVVCVEHSVAAPQCRRHAMLRMIADAGCEMERDLVVKGAASVRQATRATTGVIRRRTKIYLM